MTNIETLKLALEALEHEANIGNDNAYQRERDALRAAIVEAEKQKPVAWYYEIDQSKAIAFAPDSDSNTPWQPLYTTPPPCPTCEALARSVMMDQTGRDA